MPYNRIFLSHKRVDQEMVRRYEGVLRALGLRPWLDERELRAGDNLDKGLQDGMADSCAAVFFVTRSFRYDAYLRDEITYALAQKTARGRGFTVITLRIADHRGKSRDIPKPLKKWLWQTPKTEMEGIRNVIEALPPYILERHWFLPLHQIVPPQAERIAVIGQNLTDPLGGDYANFAGQLKLLLARRRFPSLSTVVLAMMTPQALRKVHPKAAQHMKQHTLNGLKALAKALPRDERVVVVFHPSATLSMLAVDWHNPAKAFASVTPKFQRTQKRSNNRARILMDETSFDANSLVTMIEDAEDGVDGAVKVPLSTAHATLNDLLRQARL